MNYKVTAQSIFTNDDDTEAVRVNATLNENNVRAFVWIFGGGLRITCFAADPAVAYKVNGFVADMIGESVRSKLDSFVTTNM